jgi:3-hydroxybutyryl-CoA dehydrogenase
MFSVLGDPRYRPSPWLARRAQLGLPLTQPDAADAQDASAGHPTENSQ